MSCVGSKTLLHERRAKRIMKKSKKKISLEEKVQIRPRVMSEKEISELVGGSSGKCG
jgi:hypothetical protein